MSHQPTLWLAAGALGLGLWLLNGQGEIPPVLRWIAVTLVCVGGILFVFNAWRSFSRSESVLQGLVYPLVAGLGLSVILLLAEHSFRYLSFPYPLDDGEGFVLNQAARLASGQPLYPPLGAPPYIVTNYPPLFPALLSFFTDPANPGFFAGRLISVLSMLAIFLASAGCVRAATGNRGASILAGLLALSSPVIYFWGALLRVDMLASALGMIGLWIAVSYKGWRAMWALPFALAALFTRQSSVEIAFAIVIGLALNTRSDQNPPGGNRLKGLVFLLAWAGAALAILFLLQAWTHGEFWRHTVTYTRTQFFPSRIWSALQWIVPSHALILLLAFFGLRNSLSTRPRTMLAVFFLASIATALLAGKVGSDLNYFINLTTASACLAGCFFADLTGSKAFANGRSAWIVAVLLFFPAALAQSGLIEGNRSLSFNPQPVDYSSGDRIVEILSQAHGPILSEDEGFCLLSHHEVLLNPFIMSELAREGIWDQSVFVDWIRNRGPKVIMLRFDVNDPNNDDRPGAGGNAGWDRFTEEMESAIRDSYEIDASVSPIYMRRLWFIYRPRQ